MTDNNSTVTGIVVPTYVDVIKKTDLDLPSNKTETAKVAKANIITNAKIQEYTSGDDIYSLQGVSYADMYGGKDFAINLFTKYSGISPFNTIDMLVMPSIKGAPLDKGTLSLLTQTKITALTAIAELYNNTKTPPAVKIDVKLIPAMLNDNYLDETMGPQRTILNGAIIAAKNINKAADKDKDKAIKNYGKERVDLANQIGVKVLDLKSFVRKKLPDVKMDKFLAITVFIDQGGSVNGKDFKTAYKQAHGNLNGIKVADETSAKKYMDSVLEKNDTNMFEPDYYSTIVLVKVANSSKLLSNSGSAKYSSLVRSAKGDQLLMSLIERKFFVTSPDVDEYYEFLKIGR